MLQNGFIEDVRRLLKVLLMFLPLPLFWALSDQQGSRWTLQAEHMDGDLVNILMFHLCVFRARFKEIFHFCKLKRQ